MHRFILCSNPKHQMVNCKISNMVTAIKLERFCYSMMGRWFASLFPQMFVEVLRKAFQEKDVLFSFPPLVMVTMSFLASVLHKISHLRHFLRRKFWNKIITMVLSRMTSIFFKKAFLILNLISSYVKYDLA